MVYQQKVGDYLLLLLSSGERRPRLVALPRRRLGRPAPSAAAATAAQSSSAAAAAAWFLRRRLLNAARAVLLDRLLRRAEQPRGPPRHRRAVLVVGLRRRSVGGRQPRSDVGRVGLQRALSETPFLPRRLVVARGGVAANGRVSQRGVLAALGAGVGRRRRRRDHGREHEERRRRHVEPHPDGAQVQLLRGRHAAGHVAERRRVEAVVQKTAGIRVRGLRLRRRRGRLLGFQGVARGEVVLLPPRTPTRHELLPAERRRHEAAPAAAARLRRGEVHARRAVVQRGDAGDHAPPARRCVEGRGVGHRSPLL